MGSAGRPSGPGKPRNEMQDAVAKQEELDEMASNGSAAAEADAGADAGADGSAATGSARAAVKAPADPGTQARHAERAARTSGDDDGTRKA